MQSCSFICGEDYKGKKLGVPTHADTPPAAMNVF